MLISWKRAPYSYYGTDGFSYGSPNGKAHINSLSSISGKVGDLITIYAVTVGDRRGESNVQFNGVNAVIRSWSSVFDVPLMEFLSAIEVYVPDIPLGEVQVKINVEGETVFQPALMDGAGRIIYEIGNLEDWIPLADGAYNDSALMTFNPRVELKSEYKSKGATYNDDGYNRQYINYDGTNYHNMKWVNLRGGMFPGREYRAQGIYRGPFFKGMCVMKTGRTTGTTFGIVSDPSYTFESGYTDSDWNNINPIHVHDCVQIEGPVFLDQVPYDEIDGEFYRSNLSQNIFVTTEFGDKCFVQANFADHGDSGAGVFTANYEDYVEFCHKYGLVVTVRDSETPPDPPAGLLVCTETYGVWQEGSGGGDKAYRYIDHYGLSLNRLPMDIAGATATASGTQVTATLDTEWFTAPSFKSVAKVGLSIQLGVIWYVSPDINSTTSIDLVLHQGSVWSVSPIIESVANADITIQQGTVVNLGPTNLVGTTEPLDKDSINFTLMVYLREISVEAHLGLDASTQMSVALVPPVPVDLWASEQMLTFPAQVGLAVYPVATLELGVEVPIHTLPVVAGLSVKAYLDLNALLGSRSSVIAGPQRGTVIPMIPTELVSQAANLDIKAIDFTLEGYGRAINATAPIYNLPVSASMIIDQVFTIELRAASPVIVLPSSVGLQINPAIVTPVALSIHATVGPTTKANIEMVVKLLPFFLARPDREMEVQAIINNTTYDKTEVVSFDVEDSLIPSEEFVLGSVISSKLTFTIRTSDTIPSNADISPYVRLKGPEGVTDWVPLGKYYVDTRGYQNNVWTFTCFDKLILSQQTYVSALTYPASMAAVFTELRGQLGLTADASVVINPSYTIPYKDLEITMREMLGYIASAHGASVRLTKDTEQISFVKFKPNATRTPILASEYFQEQQTNPLKTFTTIRLTYNTDGEFLTAGTGDEDHTLNIYNPFMTQAMLTTVYAAFNGFSYMPFTMDWKGNPTINVGASVIVTERSGSTFPSVILTDNASYKGGLKSTITAPSYSTQRSETDYKGGLKQFVNSQLAKGIQIEEPYYGVTIGRANGLRIAKSDGVSTATFNSDKLEIARNGSPVFKVNSDGYVELTGVKVNGGSITWGTGGVNAPTATDVGALPSTTDLSSFVTNTSLTTKLGQNYVITGLIAANRIAVGTLDGFILTGATVEAKNYLKVASNIWNGNTSTYGLQFGSTLTNYAIPATVKYYQGLAGDGSTFFEIKTAGDTQIEVRGGWFDVYCDTTIHYDLTVNSNLYVNKIIPRSGTRMYLGEYGCNFNNTSDGIMRLANGAGAYLTISGSTLTFYRANGTSIDLVP